MPTDLLTTPYPFDPTGKLLSNKIVGEQHILTTANFRDYHFIVPKLAPFFLEDLSLSFRPTSGVIRPLVEGVDYFCTHEFISASRACAQPIFGSITFLDLQLSGVVTISSYQTLGGIWTQDETKIAEIAADRLHNPRITAWDVVIDMPISFPPVDHQWDLVDMVGMSQVTDKIDALASAVRTSQLEGLAAHIGSVTNPHAVTASQVGSYTRAEVDAFFAQVNARLTALEQS
jgi:hypothetical protein